MTVLSYKSIGSDTNNPYVFFKEALNDEIPNCSEFRSDKKPTEKLLAMYQASEGKCPIKNMLGTCKLANMNLLSTQIQADIVYYQNDQSRKQADLIKTNCESFGGAFLSN